MLWARVRTYRQSGEESLTAFFFWEGSCMSITMAWPIALVVFPNIIYQICAKEVPQEMDAMASMTITYLVGAVCSAILFFALHKNGNLLQEYAKMNAAPALLGVSVVGLEVGFLYAYKVG